MLNDTFNSLKILEMESKGFGKGDVEVAFARPIQLLADVTLFKNRKYLEFVTFTLLLLNLNGPIFDTFMLSKV